MCQSSWNTKQKLLILRDLKRHAKKNNNTTPLRSRFFADLIEAMERIFFLKLCCKSNQKQFSGP